MVAQTTYLCGNSLEFSIVSPELPCNDARGVAIYLCREMSGRPCRELGRRCGGISGAAITLQHSRLGHRRARDPSLTKTVTQIRAGIAKS